MTDGFDLDDMQGIIDEFMVESDELMSQLDADLVTIEKSPDDLELLNKIFRSAHTIKGSSGFLGFTHLSSLTHRMEDVLNRLRKGELALSAGMIDVLLECVDILKEMLADIAENGQETERDLTDILAKLNNAEKGMQSTTQGNATPVKTESKQKKTGKTKAATKKTSGKKKAASPRKKKKDKTQKGEPSETAVIETDEGTSQSAPEIYPETETVAAQSSQENKLDVARKKEFLDRRKADTTIRVDVQRLDGLMNMVGELVLGRNALVQLDRNIGMRWEGEEEIEKLSQATTQVSFVTTELQMAVMQLRMLPIGNVFNKFPRVVRDLARDQGKKIDLKLIGEDTELDKTVIEEIGDPLVHLVRNSCDHGIEPPDVRRELGKPETGIIELAAAQEGSNIIIKITDDGRGIDVDRVSAKAVEKGLAMPDEIAAMSDRDIMRFIFNPGFSTAAVVTDVSGRGVGMDVVRTNIEKLNGTIDIESEKNQGTKIIIKLPLTLAIIQGLLVRVQGDVFIIPLSSVFETVKISARDISHVNKREVIRLRDTVLPILNLREVLFTGFLQEERKTLYVVVVGFAEKRLGLIVDELIGQEEVVIKSMGDYLGNTPGVAGATIMGDGRIRLIVDVGGLFKLVTSAC
jgi:two-component system chemotaxis sensor kinase CheA